MAKPELDRLYAGTSETSGKVLGAYPGLLPDILIMVFEELLTTSPTIAILRLVSKQFNDLVLPILYRRVVLHSRIVDLNTFGYNNETVSSYKMQVVRDIKRYAQHITIRDDVHEVALHKLLLSVANFRSLTLSYGDTTSAPAFSQPNSQKSTDEFLLCLASFKKVWPTLRIHVEDVDMRNWQVPQMEALHASQIVSLKIDEWNAGYRDPKLEGLAVKKLLLSMRQLKVLHLSSFNSDATILNSNISTTERLPALEELVIHGYDWQFSPTTAVTFWDWTKITHLELVRVSIVAFLRTVTVENLLHLKTFISYNHSQTLQEWNQTNNSLCKLLRHVLAPEKLSMVICCGPRTTDSLNDIADCVRAITAHGQSLKSLSLREHWISYDSHHHVELVRDVRSSLSLLRLCPNLMELTLDDAILALQSQHEFAADTLAKVPNLRRLDIQSRFFGDMDLETQEETIEKTKVMTFAWRSRLVAQKLGAKFERISLFVEVFHYRAPSAAAPLVQSGTGGTFDRDTGHRCIARLTSTYNGRDWIS